METDLQLCTHTETHCSSPRASYRQTCRNLMVLYRSNIISTSTFSNYHCTLCFPSCVGLCTYVCLRVSRSSLCKNSRKMNPAPPLVFPGMADNFSAQLRRSSSSRSGFTGSGRRLKVGVTFAVQLLSASGIHSRESHPWRCIFTMQSSVVHRNAEGKACLGRNIVFCFMEVQSTILKNKHIKIN